MKTLDLTKGSVFKTLLTYSLPLIATNVAQVLFHATDVAVLGIMANDDAVAAVGACGSLISLFISLFSGFATGANVLTANRIGAKDIEGARRGVGTSLLVGFLSGVILMVIALIGAEQFLIWMNCDPEVLDEATLYMQIYFLGMPIMMLYNTVAAILRADGDSMRPMIYMLIAGGVNVGLNFLLVGAFSMGVAGVAIATIVSNLLSLILSFIPLIKNKEYCKVEIKNIRFRKEEMEGITKVAIPTCLCSVFFYFANVVMAAGVNSLGKEAMTANTISGQFDSIIYNVSFSVAIACMAMVGQCHGAGLKARVKETVYVGMGVATGLSLFAGTLFAIFANPLLGIMSDNPAIIQMAREKLLILCFTHFVTGIMEVLSFSLRAMGYSNLTMIAGFICGFGVRSLWVWTVWQGDKTLPGIFWAYPVSAGLAIVAYFIAFIIITRNKRVDGNATVAVQPDGQKVKEKIEMDK